MQIVEPHLRLGAMLILHLIPVWISRLLLPNVKEENGVSSAAISQRNVL